MTWLAQLSEIEAASMLGECEKAVSAVLATGAVGRHDLAGRIFNRLISERKLLAAFYTSICVNLVGRAGPVRRKVAGR